MSQKIRCYTTFDITRTNVTNRARPPEDVDYNDWLKKRNQQCNLDTLLQVISMRAQPELLFDPIKTTQTLVDIWYFDFEIAYDGVFDNGKNPLGHLLQDCDGVPMINPDNTTTLIDITKSNTISFEIQHE